MIKFKLEFLEANDPIYYDLRQNAEKTGIKEEIESAKKLYNKLNKIELIIFLPCIPLVGTTIWLSYIVEDIAKLSFEEWETFDTYCNKEYVIHEVILCGKHIILSMKDKED
jgi:hypothetical protein